MKRGVKHNMTTHDNVLVIIVNERANVSRESLIKHMFSDNMFTVVSYDHSLQCGNPALSTLQDESRETAVIIGALTVAANVDEKSPVIVIKDTSVCNSCPDKVAETVRRALKLMRPCNPQAVYATEKYHDSDASLSSRRDSSRSQDDDSGRRRSCKRVCAGDGGKVYELCYLCKWLDMCQLYTKAEATEELGAKQSPSILRTRSPHGLQAVLFSPYGRDMVLGNVRMSNGAYFTLNKPLDKKLNEEIYAGNINALCTVPNLFDYDITLNAMTNQDYLKLNECVPVVLQPSSQGSSTYGDIIWFVVIVILVLILAWIAVVLGPSLINTSKSEDPSCSSIDGKAGTECKKKRVHMD